MLRLRLFLLIALLMAFALLGIVRTRWSPFVNPPAGTGDHRRVLAEVSLPPGYRISLYAYPVPEARSMSVTPGGWVFVGSRGAGTVRALRDGDGDGFAETTRIIASGLVTPNGIAFCNGSLYVAEQSRIIRFDDIESRVASPPVPVLVNGSFPDDPRHGWKYLRFGPDGKLYVSVGAPGNICDSQDGRFSTIMRLNADGSGLEVFARGVRNSLGFDWHPKSQEFWFTENGRDWMGDDVPPCELNRAPRQGMHFGFPYFHGNQIPDPEFAAGKSSRDFEPCAQELGAHVAPLGMLFCDEFLKTASGSHRLLIAEHGSWNRSRKSGYRIMSVTLDGDIPVASEPFADGFMKNEQVFGRPVDLAFLSENELLVSDDFAGAIYRISRESASDRR